MILIIVSNNITIYIKINLNIIKAKFIYKQYIFIYIISIQL